MREIGLPETNRTEVFSIDIVARTSEAFVLTKLEVDGFKNLEDLKIEFGPFTCIAGPNGVGKSNIFDVIKFMSLLADHDINEAALLVRDTSGEANYMKGMTSDLSDLFARGSDGNWKNIKIAAEMIVESSVKDEFNRDAKASSTYLRYEIELEYQRVSDKYPLGAITLNAENLNYITAGDAKNRLKFPRSTAFIKSIIENRRRSSGYISTVRREGQPTEIHVHQDGGSSGQPQKAPANIAPRTILSTTTTSTTPTILSARREMQKWRLLALEPSSMRAASRFHTEPYVSSTGGNLPAALYRLMREEPESQDVLDRISSRLNELVRLKGVRINKDDTRQLLTIEVEEQDGSIVPARSLSDGTLRLLALSIMEADGADSGVICMEEPENGIHPGNMPVMQRLLMDMAVDTDHAVDSENPMKQMIIATHSPRLVALQEQNDLLYAFRKQSDFDGVQKQTFCCLPLHDTWRVQGGGDSIGLSAIHHYLTLPDDRQLKFPQFEVQ